MGRRLFGCGTHRISSSVFATGAIAPSPLPAPVMVVAIWFDGHLTCCARGSQEEAGVSAMASPRACDPARRTLGMFPAGSSHKELLHAPEDGYCSPLAG